MKLPQDSLRDIASLEAAWKAQLKTSRFKCSIVSYRAKPTSLLTPVFSSRLIFSETTRYGSKWRRRSLRNDEHFKRVKASEPFAYSLRPVDGNIGAVNIRRRLVLQILEAGVAGLLSETCLIAEVEKASNAVLARFKIVILDKPEAIVCKKESIFDVKSWIISPFAEARVKIDDRLATLDFAKANRVIVK